MQIMSDSQFQYTSNQNQFQRNYDGRKTLSVDKKKYIFVVLSRILARENTVFCMASDRVIHEPPVFTIFSLDFLSSTKIQYKETNYDADNIDNNK